MNWSAELRFGAASPRFCPGAEMKFGAPFGGSWPVNGSKRRRRRAFQKSVAADVSPRHSQGFAPTNVGG
jgi:hypothetical protein